MLDLLIKKLRKTVLKKSSDVFGVLRSPSEAVLFVGDAQSLRRCAQDRVLFSLCAVSVELQECKLEFFDLQGWLGMAHVTVGRLLCQYSSESQRLPGVIYVILKAFLKRISAKKRWSLETQRVLS